jgi:putative SOS response-associated peptidase YedK
MCGRYTLTQRNRVLLEERFEATGEVPAETLGRFNVCPTEPVLAVTTRRESAERKARALRWGLVTPGGRGPQPINARAETVLARPLFAGLVRDADRRCLVIADGWYEWLRPENPKGERVPFRYTVDGGEPFAFAGLWARGSVTVLTTSANAICAPVHDRMPCVLAGPAEEAAWLSRDVTGDAALALLATLDGGRCHAAPANPAVNRAGVEGEHLLTAAVRADSGQAEPAATLF